MRFFFLGFVLFTFLTKGQSQSFFSKFLGRDSSRNSLTNEDDGKCEKTKILPRIALAVVGGTRLTVDNSAPYIAALGERLENGSVAFFCGGSILSSTMVLTAAHCVLNRNVDTVRLGSFTINNRPDDKDYKVQDKIVHPGYRSPVSYDDVAILKLASKIRFSSNVRPVCLTSDSPGSFAGKTAKVIGWGAEEVGGDGTHELQQVEVDIFANDDCDKSYKNSSLSRLSFPEGIHERQLCAGSHEGGKDACQGDSGGPLVLADENGVIRQVGIVSTGAGCGFKAYPGVYSRISGYTNWIRKQLRPENFSGENSTITFAET